MSVGMPEEIAVEICEPRRVAMELNASLLAVASILDCILEMKSSSSLLSLLSSQRAIDVVAVVYTAEYAREARRPVVARRHNDEDCDDAAALLVLLRHDD
eukprot:734266_1